MGSFINSYCLFCAGLEHHVEELKLMIFLFFSFFDFHQAVYAAHSCMVSLRSHQANALV